MALVSDSKNSEGPVQFDPAYLEDLAKHILEFFEHTSRTAHEALKSEESTRALGSNVFADANTMADDKPQRNLSNITSNKVRELAQIANEPAIARLVIKNEKGHEKILYVSRAGTLSGGGDDVLVASYRSPMGRLAELPVGHDADISTGAGTRNYELRERAALKAKRHEGFWDSINTSLQAVGLRSLTIRSLRQLLIETGPTVLDHLQSWISADEDKNTTEGIKRDVLTKMGLRDQPLLDHIQGNIFRLPLDTRLIVLGPPGTGKTTTLIRRLGLKLDQRHLDDREERVVARTVAGVDGHVQSWMMFTPTELLKQYVKEAFSREGIAASDERIKTWSDYRRELARSRLGIWRTETNNASFVHRPSLDPFLPGTSTRQIAWFDDFDQWQTNDFLQTLLVESETLKSSGDASVTQLGTLLASVLDRRISIVDKLIGVADQRERLQSFVQSLQSETDDKIRFGLGKLFQINPQIPQRLMTFVATLEDATEELDDVESDEEEDARPAHNRNAAIDACLRAVRAQARAAASGRTLAKGTRSARLIDFLGEVLPREEVIAVGAALRVQTAARRFLNPTRSYVLGIPRRFRRFRRTKQAEKKWYRDSGFTASDLAPAETDAIILATLLAGRALLRDVRVSYDIDQASIAFLKVIQATFRTQIVVDEVTDFSPIQLACMANLSDPAANSFFACGDFQQRITTWGTRSKDELNWVSPNISVQSINVSYRHSEQLNELAYQIALLSDRNSQKTGLPSEAANRGFAPVIGYNLEGTMRIAKWLAQRIREIEVITGFLPSTAILVNAEEDVVPLVNALNDVLSERSIRAVACSLGQSVGQDHDVRVFDVQHIKGLEFEAVFFVDLDELALLLPDLFDKYLYVGSTRAATFLGITTKSSCLPAAIAQLATQFQQSWIR